MFLFLNFRQNCGNLWQFNHKKVHSTKFIKASKPFLKLGSTLAEVSYFALFLLLLILLLCILPFVLLHTFRLIKKLVRKFQLAVHANVE